MEGLIQMSGPERDTLVSVFIPADGDGKIHLEMKGMIVDQIMATGLIVTELAKASNASFKDIIGALNLFNDLNEIGNVFGRTDNAN